MKKRVFVIAASLVVVGAAFIAFAFVFLSDPKTNSDPVNFLNKKYTSFPGGKKAEVFFEKYVELSDYEQIRFFYYNAEHKITLYKTYTMFLVDVKYDSETYKDVFERIYPDTQRPQKEEWSSCYGNFLKTKIMLDEPLYKDNCCCVFFNDKTNTVRYVFLYKAARDRIVYPIRYVFFAGIDENDDWE